MTKITLQQEQALEIYNEAVCNEGLEMEFWDWYVKYCAEEGFFYDRCSFQDDKE